MNRAMTMMTGAMMLAGVAAGAGARLPERLLSGYTGHFLKGEAKVSEHHQTIFAAMGRAGFNSVEVKIQQSRAPYMDVFADRDEIAAIIAAANAQGLVFQVYLYPEPGHARRTESREKHRLLPAVVDAEGQVVGHSFMLRDIRVWRELFHHAYQFARLARELPIAALKFDIETIATLISYDDDTWEAYCLRQPEFSAALPAAERHASLVAGDALADYEQFFAGEVAMAVKRFAEELHGLNPSLVLGYMPYRDSWIGLGFNHYLATPDAPAIMDDWCMYNGGGFSEAVVANHQRIKAFNPNNRHVPWFRVNSYDPADLASQAYHAGAATDGYSMWVMTMLDEATNKRKGYDLPGEATPADYFQAYGRANAALREDMAAGTLGTPTRIPLQPAKVMVPPLDFSDLVIPALTPVGSGDVNTGTGAFVLRNQQNIFIHARAGEELQVTLTHLAGRQRPIALVYALLDGQKKVLRNEAVTPGSEDTFKVTAPATGVYALVVTGGIGGQAWYRVRIGNPHFAVDARQSAYFFRPQTVYVPGRDRGNAVLKIGLQETESHIHSLNDGEKVHLKRQGPVTIDLPDGIVKVQFEESPVSWSQNFLLSFPKGRVPYVYASPERLLLPSED